MSLQGTYAAFHICHTVQIILHRLHIAAIASKHMTSWHIIVENNGTFYRYILLDWPTSEPGFICFHLPAASSYVLIEYCSTGMIHCTKNAEYYNHRNMADVNVAAQRLIGMDHVLQEVIGFEDVVGNRNKVGYGTRSLPIPVTWLLWRTLMICWRMDSLSQWLYKWFLWGQSFHAAPHKRPKILDHLFPPSWHDIYYCLT